jgi:hypothetical protein
VSPPDIFFSLEFSSQGAPAALLEQLSSQLLTHVGVKAGDLPELASALQKAVAAGSAALRPSPGGVQPRCDVQFRVTGSKLEIVVTANGGRVWQTERRIP